MSKLKKLRLIFSAFTPHKQLRAHTLTKPKLTTKRRVILKSWSYLRLLCQVRITIACVNTR